jgi:hypothetical protein
MCSKDYSRYSVYGVRFLDTPRLPERDLEDQSLPDPGIRENFKDHYRRVLQPCRGAAAVGSAGAPRSLRQSDRRYRGRVSLCRTARAVNRRWRTWISPTIIASCCPHAPSSIANVGKNVSRPLAHSHAPPCPQG